MSGKQTVTSAYHKLDKLHIWPNPLLEQRDPLLGRAGGGLLPPAKTLHCRLKSKAQPSGLRTVVYRYSAVCTKDAIFCIFIKSKVKFFHLIRKFCAIFFGSAFIRKMGGSMYWPTSCTLGETNRLAAGNCPNKT